MDGLIVTLMVIWFAACGTSIWVIKRSIDRFYSDQETLIEFRTAPLKRDIAKLRQQNERLSNEKLWSQARLRDAQDTLLAAQRMASAEVELLEEPPVLPKPSRSACKAKKPAKFKR